MRAILLLLFYGVPALAQSTPPHDLAHYLVHQTGSPIMVDGHLDEFAWEQAEQINDFTRILNDYGQILNPTRAKMLWDETNLYIAFSCTDQDMWAVLTNEDDHLWDEEVVEVFIDPDGDGRNYLELEVNPLNTVVDLLIYQVKPKFGSSIDWDIAGLQTAVQTYGSVNDSLARDLGWTCEIAIPFAALADSVLSGDPRPKVGTVWRLNLYRIERSAGRNSRLEILAMYKHFLPIRDKISALLGDKNEEELDQASRKELTQLQAQMAGLEEQYGEKLRSLSEAYHRQTEYTAWSETYERGFHHPARFGMIQFAE